VNKDATLTVYIRQTTIIETRNAWQPNTYWFSRNWI